MEYFAEFTGLPGYRGNANPEKVASPVADTTGVTQNGIFDFLSGTLSKAADTAIDIWGLRESAKYSTPGTVYPSGQVDPATVVSEQRIQQQETINTVIRSVAIGGTALIVIGGIFWLVGTKRKG